MKYLTMLSILIILIVGLVSCAPAAEPTPAAATDPGVTAVTSAGTADGTADAPADAPSDTPTRAKLIIADQFVPEILDGQQSFGGYPLSHELISQPLLRYDAETGAFVPDLVESFSLSDDGTTMTIKLPEGYQYSNGDALDAQALADAINRYVAVSPYSFDYDGLETVNVVDSTTAEIVNALGFNIMKPTLMSSFGAPWDVAAAKAAGDETFASNPVASGPFKLKSSWMPGQDLELIRNDNYQTNMAFVENKGPAHLEEVLVRFIADGQTRANELEAGSVDIVSGLPASAANAMKDNPDYQIFKVVLPGQTSISMNTAQAPFDDINVRKAVAMALNREQLEVALNGNMTAEYGFITSNMIAYDAAAQAYARELYPNDIEAAKALLAEAGWEDSDGDGIVDKNGEPFSVEFLVDSGSVMETDAAPVVQAQLKEIGIDLQIAQHDMGYIYDTMVAGDYKMGFSGYIWVDPDILTYRFTEGSSPSQFVSDELVNMLDAARSVSDTTARTAAYLDIQKYLLDNIPMIPLMSENLYYGARSWVQGIRMVAPDRLLLNDVTIVEK